MVLLLLTKSNSLIERATTTARYLKSKLRDSLIEYSNIGEIRGSGLINAIFKTLDR